MRAVRSATLRNKFYLICVLVDLRRNIITSDIGLILVIYMNDLKRESILRWYRTKSVQNYFLSSFIIKCVRKIIQLLLTITSKNNIFRIRILAKISLIRRVVNIVIPYAFH